MNKISKYLLMAAGACTIAGFGLCIAGGLLGGQPGFWIRRDGLFTNQQIKSQKAGQMAVLEKTEMEPFTGINIRVDDNHITVKPSGDGHYYLEYQLFTRKNQPEYGVKDGTLNLTCLLDKDDPSSSGLFGFFVIESNGDSQTGQVTVYVPETAQMDQVKLYASDGNVTYDGPEADTLDITSKYGNIDLKQASAKRAILSLSDGNAVCSEGNFTDLMITNKYGNTSLSGITASNINIQASDGNIKMQDISTKSLTAENKYGSTNVTQVTADSLELTQDDGSCSVKQADIKDGRFENKYGNITLELMGAENDYNYDLQMKYGDIKINDQSFEEQNVRLDHGADRSIQTDSKDGTVRIRTR